MREAYFRPLHFRKTCEEEGKRENVRRMRHRRSAMWERPEKRVKYQSRLWLDQHWLHASETGWETMTLSRKKWKADSIVAIKDSTSVPVLILWTVISVTVSLLCCWSYLHPAWTVRSSYSPVGGKSVTDATMARRPLVRSAIPLVQIGLHSMCIYSHRQRFDTATCVSHAHLDDEWLPATWQVT